MLFIDFSLAIKKTTTKMADKIRLDKVYIHDQRKKIGYRYNLNLGLYEPVNKSHILHREDQFELIQKDLRPYMNRLPPDEIPLRRSGDNQTDEIMFNCTTHEKRPRNEHDYVTYALPLFMHLVDSRVEAFFNQLSPLASSLKKTLREFCSGAGPEYIIVEGPLEAFEILCKTLLTLSPLVLECNSRLYTELYVSKRVVEEVASARIVCTSIGKRTLRQSNLSEFKALGSFPIQFRGIVHRFPTAEVTDEAVYPIALPAIDIEITADQLLQWLLGEEH